MPNPLRNIIVSRNKEICRAYAAGDADGVAEAFAEDCWQMPPNTEPLVGREAVRGFWRQAFGYGRWEFALETREVVGGEGLAVERGRYRMRFRPGAGAPPGMAPADDRGNYVVLWRLEPAGQWRVLWDAPVSELPLPVMPEREAR